MTVSLPTKKLTSKAALTAAQAAVSHGLDLNVRINAAIVDAGGHLMAFWKADGAFLPSAKIAQDKAYTAVGFGMSSRKLYAVIKDEPDVRDGIIKQPRVAALPGGLPILDGSEIIGAIGISGASAEQDELCAKVGIIAIGLHTHEE